MKKTIILFCLILPLHIRASGSPDNPTFAELYGKPKLISLQKTEYATKVLVEAELTIPPQIKPQNMKLDDISLAKQPKLELPKKIELQQQMELKAQRLERKMLEIQIRNSVAYAHEAQFIITLNNINEEKRAARTAMLKAESSSSCCVIS